VCVCERESSRFAKDDEKGDVFVNRGKQEMFLFKNTLLPDILTILFIDGERGKEKGRDRMCVLCLQRAS